LRLIIINVALFFVKCDAKTNKKQTAAEAANNRKLKNENSKTTL